MPLERDAILLDNLKGTLALYRVGVVLFCPLAVFAAMASNFAASVWGGASATSCRTRWAAC